MSPQRIVEIIDHNLLGAAGGRPVLIGALLLDQLAQAIIEFAYKVAFGTGITPFGDNGGGVAAAIGDIGPEHMGVGVGTPAAALGGGLPAAQTPAKFVITLARTDLIDATMFLDGAPEGFAVREGETIDAIVGLVGIWSVVVWSLGRVVVTGIVVVRTVVVTTAARDSVAGVGAAGTVGVTVSQLYNSV